MIQPIAMVNRILPLDDRGRDQSLMSVTTSITQMSPS